MGIQLVEEGQSVVSSILPNLITAFLSLLVIVLNLANTIVIIILSICYSLYIEEE